MYSPSHLGQGPLQLATLRVVPANCLETPVWPGAAGFASAALAGALVAAAGAAGLACSAGLLGAASFGAGAGAVWPHAARIEVADTPAVVIRNERRVTRRESPAMNPLLHWFGTVFARSDRSGRSLAHRALDELMSDRVALGRSRAHRASTTVGVGGSNSRRRPGS